MGWRVIKETWFPETSQWTPSRPLTKDLISREVCPIVIQYLICLRLISLGKHTQSRSIDSSNRSTCCNIVCHHILGEVVIKGLQYTYLIHALYSSGPHCQRLTVFCLRYRFILLLLDSSCIRLLGLYKR